MPCPPRFCVGFLQVHGCPPKHKNHKVWQISFSKFPHSVWQDVSQCPVMDWGSRLSHHDSCNLALDKWLRMDGWNQRSGKSQSSKLLSYLVGRWPNDLSCRQLLRKWEKLNAGPRAEVTASSHKQGPRRQAEQKERGKRARGETAVVRARRCLAQRGTAA